MPGEIDGNVEETKEEATRDAPLFADQREHLCVHSAPMASTRGDSRHITTTQEENEIARSTANAGDSPDGFHLTCTPIVNAMKPCVTPAQIPPTSTRHKFTQR